jgi:peptidoglycan/xylan/chitin deacetylase (PgdA/CDA1 family)
MQFRSELKYFITRLNSLFSSATAKDSLRVLLYHSINLQGDQRDLWTLDRNTFIDHLDHLLSIDSKFYKLLDLVESVPDNGIVITFDDGRLDNFDVAAPELLKREIPFSIFVISDYIKQGRRGYLSEEILIELSRNPLISIGSHGATHRKLSKLTGEALLFELQASKDYLEDLLNIEIQAFSYPHGDYCETMKPVMKKLGYKIAFTSNFGPNAFDQDKFSLNRTEIWNTDKLNIFQQKLNGNWDWLKYRNL